MSKNDIINVEARPAPQATLMPLLNQIRPVWKGKKLIERVQRLLPVDPGSACQRLFNAAIHDLREKIIIVGADLAKDAVKNYKLPPINNEEDIWEYSTARLIDLSYRIGILSRPEWRRIHRCYEIRRDLEHEDNEYEAVLEDCIYIFKSSIDIVLSQDPVELLKVMNVKQIVETPSKISITDEYLSNYERAPILRQFEIMQYLISIAGDESQPDIVRENCLEMLRAMRVRTQTPVIIDVAKKLEEKHGRSPLTFEAAKLAYISGAFGYFKCAKLSDFYKLLLEEFKASIGKWDKEANAAIKFDEIGSFEYCPDDLKKHFLKYLVRIYLGEPGSYGVWGQNRAVFFSDEAAPVILKIISGPHFKLLEEFEILREDRNIKSKLLNRHILRRFEHLFDTAQRRNK
jgi:hypothetical protein